MRFETIDPIHRPSEWFKLVQAATEKVRLGSQLKDVGGKSGFKWGGKNVDYDLIKRDAMNAVRFIPPVGIAPGSA